MASVLVVDDVPENREYLLVLLEYHGHRVRESADGRAALRLAQSESFDLIITDVLMPVMDGYELLRQLRDEASTREVPVVFYTAHYGASEARALARARGVSWVLTKPVPSDEFISVVERVLRGESETGAAPDYPTIPAFDSGHLRLLTDKLSETVEDVRGANAKLRAVINIALELSSERDLDRLLDRVCVAGRDLFGATYVTLGVLNLDELTVRRFASCGTSTTGYLEVGDSVDGLLAQIVTARQTVRGENPGGESAKLKLPSLHPNVHAFLAAPVASPANVYGWMCFVANDGRVFTEEDEQLVTALAGLVGRIYESGYFFEVAQQRSIALEHERDERLWAEEAVRQERDRAQQYLDTAEVILLALDLQSRITLINRKGCQVLGWSEDALLGRDWIDTCIPVRLREALRLQLRDVSAGDLSAVENLVITHAGEERLIEWCNTLQRDSAGDVVGTFSSGLDVTERRKLETEYQQAQKMEAVGQLAAGVAHDFNNLLTVILGYSGLLLGDVDQDARRQADIAEIHHAGERAEVLTRQLLTFSRKQVVQPTVLNLNVLVTELQPMLTRLIREDISVALRLQSQSSLVTADRGQLEQIVLNLAVNARDAMPTGGSLTIETTDVRCDEPEKSGHGLPPAGAYVMLAVSDTGVGMTPDVQEMLFQPFFTTKGPGKGTGLGLTTVHGIVTRIGGHICVQSDVGRGTTFKIYFQRSASLASSADAPALALPERKGKETVLVVEDEDRLRELTKRLLTKQGYTVLAAATAEEALLVCERNPAIDVLLTDVVMPGASGPKLTEWLAGWRPGLKVIYMSGHAEHAIVHYGVLDPMVAFLNKPFNADTLGRKIRDVLDQ